MASAVCITDSKEGSMRKNEKNKVVILGTKHDRKQEKDISKEPEMIELKRMIRDGELDKDRTIDHMEKGDKTEE